VKAMALNIDTQDLVNYPGNVKRVEVDQELVVTNLDEGDESFVLNFSTTAYSNNTLRTKIQDYYMTNFKAGWCKSSGFTGSGGKFALDSTHSSIEIKIDSTTSGISDGYYRITLDHDDGLPLDGSVIANGMGIKIRELADTFGSADIGYKLAYMNAIVEFNNGRFWIVSGSVGNYYSGTYKTSVSVRESSVNDASVLLGFNLQVTSEDIDALSIKEALVVGNYTVSGTTMVISQNLGATTNDCLLITDGTNIDYFQLNSEPTSGGTVLTFDADRITNDYTANESKVQLFRLQDPDAEPMLWFSSVDKVARHGVKSIVNQIDYSS
jgi:hypothetical protein